MQTIIPENPSDKPPLAQYTTLIDRAEAIITEILDMGLPDPEMPEGMEDYQVVAAFTSEAVSQTTNEWGHLKLTFKVNGETKWAAMRATDFPGQRLAVVIYALEDKK